MASEAIPPNTPAEATAEVDLQAEVEAIQREQASSSERISRPLVGFTHLKVVLMSLPANGRWDQHKTVGRISVQTLVGHIRIRAQGKTFDVPCGRMLALESNVPHDVEAVQASVFLLTVAKS